MKITKTKLDGVVIIEPDVFGDNRGFFMESWNKRKWRKLGFFMTLCRTTIQKVR